MELRGNACLRKEFPRLQQPRALQVQLKKTSGARKKSRVPAADAWVSNRTGKEKSENGRRACLQQPRERRQHVPRQGSCGPMRRPHCAEE
eukprot:scaffold21346_cov51-Isochrysis_galbana.AAC.1